MYLLSINVSNTIVGHIQDANSPNKTWDSLIKFNANNTKVRKVQLKNELNTIKRGEQSINEYTLKNKSLFESLSSNGATIDDDDKVDACLHGLGTVYKQFKASIRTQESILDF